MRLLGREGREGVVGVVDIADGRVFLWDRDYKRGLGRCCGR